jgi:hypothetical protein
MNTVRALVVAGCVTLLTACSSGSQVDIGDGSTAQGLNAYAHGWDGHAEAFQFRDGTDRVRITLDGAGKGTIRLGETPLLPAPAAGDPPPPLAVETDFAFPVEGHLEDERLRFDLNDWTRYGAWCELQTPVLLSPDYPDVYACHRLVKLSMGNPDGTCVDVETGEVSLCDTLTVCSGNCVCDSESCEVSPMATSDAFDGTLSSDGQELSGTLVLHGGNDRVIVRLRRQ